jgi:hypothetical protein
MVPGLRLDWDKGTIEDVTSFGYCTWKELPSGKKLVGRGTKFFWLQMLMGDTADNTQGLPKIVVPGAKPKLCGQSAADKLLANCNNDRDCLRVVLPLYVLYGEQVGFKNYRDGADVLGVDVFKSEARLHWMRRYKDDKDDVLKWLREIQ